MPGGQQILNQLLGTGLAAVLDELTRDRPTVTIHLQPRASEASSVAVRPRNSHVVTILDSGHVTVIGSAPMWPELAPLAK